MTCERRAQRRVPRAAAWVLAGAVALVAGLVAAVEPAGTSSPSREQQRAVLGEARRQQLGRQADAPLSTPETSRAPAPEQEAPPAAAGEAVAPVRLMPAAPEGRPFGYEVFANVSTTFAPATDIPVPAEYVLGPDDTLEVRLIAEGGGRYTPTGGRDAIVDFPNLGPATMAAVHAFYARPRDPGGRLPPSHLDGAADAGATRARTA